jgi:hypothetical protein
VSMPIRQGALAVQKGAHRLSRLDSTTYVTEVAHPRFRAQATSLATTTYVDHFMFQMGLQADDLYQLITATSSVPLSPPG